MDDAPLRATLRRIAEHDFQDGFEAAALASATLAADKSRLAAPAPLAINAARLRSRCAAIIARREPAEDVARDCLELLRAVRHLARYCPHACAAPCPHHRAAIELGLLTLEELHG